MLATPLACVLDQQLGGDAGTGGSGDGDASVGDGTTDAPTIIPLEQASASMAAARCAAWFACDCGATFSEAWSSQAACETDVGAYFDQQIASGQGSGLVYDGACVGSFVEFYEDTGCTPASLASYAAYTNVWHCDIFHGDLDVGGACGEQFSLMPIADACGPNLVCSGGQCEEIHARGEPCNPAEIAPAGCEFPLFCDPETQDPVRCNDRRGAGESCGDGVQCDFDSWCDAGTCQPKTAAGEPCSRPEECLYGNCAPSGTCVELAAVCTPYLVAGVDECGEARAAVAEFIEQNESCEVDEDCIALDAICYDLNVCGSIPANTSHDPEAWAQLSAALDNAACTDCGADPCGAVPHCENGTCQLSAF